jgi:hypothetical protein
MFRTNNQSYNSFKQSNSSKPLKHKHTNNIQTNKNINKQIIDVNDTELFPDLSISNKQNQLTNSTITIFKDIITNTDKHNIVINEPDDSTMEVFIDNDGNTVYKYGNTNTQLNKQLNNELKLNQNYIMDQVIMALNKNTQKYMLIYDSIHGEGAYDEKFASIIYHNELYDTEVSDVESETTDEDVYNY